MLQIHLRDLKIHGGLSHRLVPSAQEGAGFILVLRAETGLFVGFGVLAVKRLTATEQNESLFHTALSFLAVRISPVPRFTELYASRGRAVAQLCPVTQAPTHLTRRFTDARGLPTSNSLSDTRMKMEPVVGIG